MLGDLGARVIKVESATGDDTRAWGPPWAGDPGPDDAHDSTYFMSANRNKESIVLDLKDPADQDVLARLVARADVLLENFRTGVLDRLGFPVARLHELNPGLVVGSITGFGHDGPEAVARRLRPDRPGRGRADEPDRRGRADQGRRADRRPAGRHEPRCRRAGRAARTRTHRPGSRRAHLSAGGGGRRARLPGHALDDRRRGAGPVRVAPPGHRAVRHVRDGDLAGAGGRGVGGAVGAVRCRARAGRGGGAFRDQPLAGGAP